jgi:hypothetical protein
MKQIFYPAALLLMLAGGSFLSGCRTADEARSGHMASVEISGHTAAEIRHMTIKVFLAEGYVQANGLGFEKKASVWDMTAYGGWSGDVWLRLRAGIHPLEADRYILNCDAYLVQDRNQAAMEMEQKNRYANRSDCKKILDEIKAKLDVPEASNP